MIESTNRFDSDFSEVFAEPVQAETAEMPARDDYVDSVKMTGDRCINALSKQIGGGCE